MSTASIDTGILVAITNSNENQARVQAIMARLLELRRQSVPFITTTAVITEAMYLCRKRRGPVGAVALIANLKKFAISIVDPESPEGVINNFDFLQDQSVNVDYADFHLFSAAIEYESDFLLTVDSKDFFILSSAFPKLLPRLPYKPETTRLTVEIQIF